MTPQEAVSYIENYGWSTTKLGLGRTKALLHAFGDPQKKLKFVHVAGSNGKGSTCAMLASVLKEAGYRTGLYTSPYIQEFYERIQIDGENIEPERLAEITERAKAIADEMDDHPSQFELVTAIAIQYFLEEACDIVVLEVGMGGALDSTNAIDSPEVAVFTNIGLEHTEYLGDTVEEIAKTKSGIIKAGASCVCYDAGPEITDVIKAKCRDENVDFRLVDFSEGSLIEETLDGQRFTWHGDEYFLSLVGPHQLLNAMTCLNTIDALRERGWEISDEAVKRGLVDVKWPARFEILAREPLFILDGGHNPQCAEALVESAKELLAGEKIVFLLGVLADKDYGSIIEMMKPLAAEFICVTPLSDRALPAEELARYIEGQGLKATYCTNIPEGIVMALDAAGESPVIAFGSLYLAGAVRTEFIPVYKNWLRKKCKAARRNLGQEKREEKSLVICQEIERLPEVQSAGTVMLYKAVPGEVIVDYLDGKLPGEICYPYWTEEDMIAVVPGDGDDAWIEISKNYLAPNPEKGRVIKPEDIDAVISPVVGFDDAGNRLGMGGGFYDGFLPLCTKAKVIGVAFTEQKVAKLLPDPWDVPIETIVYA